MHDNLTSPFAPKICVYVLLTSIARTDKKVIFFVPRLRSFLRSAGKFGSKDNWTSLIRCFWDVSEDNFFSLSVIGVEANAVITVKVGHGIAANVPFIVS